MKTELKTFNIDTNIMIIQPKGYLVNNYYRLSRHRKADQRLNSVQVALIYLQGHFDESSNSEVDDWHVKSI